MVTDKFHHQIFPPYFSTRNSSNWTSHFSEGHLVVEPWDPVRIPETWGFAAEANCHVVALWRRQLWGLIRHPGGDVGKLWGKSMGIYVEHQ